MRGCVEQTHHLGKTVHAKPFEDRPASPLNGAGAHRQIIRNGIVCSTTQDSRQRFLLSRSQRGQAAACILHRQDVLAAFFADPEGLANLDSQLLRRERCFEDVHRAAPDRQHCLADRGRPGNKHDGQRRFQIQQPALDAVSNSARHLKVCDDTAGKRHVGRSQKRVSRCVRTELEAKLLDGLIDSRARTQVKSVNAGNVHFRLRVENRSAREGPVSGLTKEYELKASSPHKETRYFCPKPATKSGESWNQT